MNPLPSRPSLVNRVTLAPFSTKLGGTGDGRRRWDGEGRGVEWWGKWEVMFWQHYYNIHAPFLHKDRNGGASWEHTRHIRTRQRSGSFPKRTQGWKSIRGTRDPISTVNIEAIADVGRLVWLAVVCLLGFVRSESLGKRLQQKSRNILRNLHG